MSCVQVEYRYNLQKYPFFNFWSNQKLFVFIWSSEKYRQRDELPIVPKSL